MADGDNTFTGLKADARDGGFTPTDPSKGLNFNHDVATTLATHCATLLDTVDAALEVVRPTTDLKALNQRTSGASLADKFNAAAKNLVETVLKNHQAILTDMGETFAAAGGIYSTADQGSAEAFNGKYTDQQLSSAFQSLRAKPGQPGLAVSGIHVDSVKLPGWGQSSWSAGWDGTDNGYSWSGTAKKDYGNKLTDTQEVSGLNNSAHANGVTLDPVYIEPDYGAQYEWDDFHNHWVHVKDSKVVDQLANFAQEWHTAHVYIKAEVANFKAAAMKYLQGYQGNMSEVDKVWASPAALKAQTAIVKYLTNLEGLTNSMAAMSENYAFANGWLKKLQNFLPYNSISDTYPASSRSANQSEIDKAMKAMREAWNNWYVEGLKDSSAAVPIMQDPKAAIAVEPPKQEGPPNPKTTQVDNTSPSGSPKVQTPNLDNADPANTNPTNTNPTNTNPTTTNPTNTNDTSLSTIASTLSSMVSTGAQALETVATQISTAIQSAQKTTTTTTSPTDTTTTTTSPVDTALTNLASLISGGGSPSSTNPITTGGSPTTVKTDDKTTTKLYPRATVADDSGTTTSTTTSRAGLASTSTSGTSSTTPMSGSPMGSSGAAGGQGQKDYKRASYLNSAQNLDEVLNVAPEAVTSVAEK
ncbi:hypothetical protein AB0N05_21975 [Nocardia sp. NPDC051030]|uniref:hypothetical protein n=1 Tax=Nocardia sp. NPDC051030 TaxID=3155162 RepID=UPI00343C00B9